MPMGISWGKGSGCALLLALGLLAQGGLDVELDAHLLADDHAAGLERLVVGQAPVFAVDLGRRRERHGLGTPRRGVGAVELEIEHDRPGDVAYRQIAGELPVFSVTLERRALEGQG